jgi:sec-independent protein translocase protein TatA
MGNPNRELTMGFDNPIHIAFLLIILLLVFGAKRLPEIGRSLGDGMRGFKQSISGEWDQAPAADLPRHEGPSHTPAVAAAPIVATAPAPDVSPSPEAKAL